MSRITLFLKQGYNKVSLDYPMVTNFRSRMIVKNVSIFWDSVNIITGENDTFVVERKTVTIPQGYWTFTMLQGLFKREGITLSANEWNNTCSIKTGAKILYLMKLSLLLGFTDDYTVQANTVATSSSQVDINRSLRYVTINCNLVDNTRNIDPEGKRSSLVCTLPITSQQKLNGTVTFFGNRDCNVPLYNGVFSEIIFNVGDNTTSTHRMNVLVELEIK